MYTCLALKIVSLSFLCGRNRTVLLFKKKFNMRGGSSSNEPYYEVIEETEIASTRPHEYEPVLEVVPYVYLCRETYGPCTCSPEAEAVKV